MRSQSPWLSSTALVALLLISSSVSAQSGWWYPDQHPAVTFEMQRPHYANQDYFEVDPELLNMVGFVGGRIRVGHDLILLWEFPFVNLDVDEGSIATNFVDQYYFEEDQFAIGNPMIGVEQSVGRGLFTRASIRFPLADDKKPLAEWTGITTAYDRFEAFVPDLFTVGANIGYREPDTSTPLDAQLLIGPTFMIPTEGDAELFVDFSAYLGVTILRAQIGAIFGGRCLVTQSVNGFSDRFINSLGAIARLKLGPVEPGLHVRYTLDAELRDFIDYTYGLDLAIPFGKERVSSEFED